MVKVLSTADYQKMKETPLWIITNDKGWPFCTQDPESGLILEMYVFNSSLAAQNHLDRLAKTTQGIKIDGPFQDLNEVIARYGKMPHRFEDEEGLVCQSITGFVL